MERISRILTNYLIKNKVIANEKKLFTNMDFKLAWKYV